MSDFFQNIKERARQNPQRIVFPESDNEMILRAAGLLVEEGTGYPVLIGNETVIREQMNRYGISQEGIQYVNPAEEETRSEIAAAFSKAFPEVTEKSVLRRIKDPVNCAMYLLKLGRADGVAAGRVYTTADVILSAQNILGLKEGFQNISSLGILNVPGFEGPEGAMLAIADCAVNPEPDGYGLADIAIASADTVTSLLGWEPRIAMLAFSTDGSSEHPSIDVIREGIRLVKERRPDLKIDGEFQLDTAIIPKVAAAKVKRESQVAGQANILIFPNLHAGNIGVKLIQNFAHGDAYGPVLQGFSRPVCDFSRSAPLSEMMGNILMLIIRAQAEGEVSS